MFDHAEPQGASMAHTRLNCSRIIPLRFQWTDHERRKLVAHVEESADLKLPLTEEELYRMTPIEVIPTPY